MPWYHPSVPPEKVKTVARQRAENPALSPGKMPPERVTLALTGFSRVHQLEEVVSHDGQGEGLVEMLAMAGCLALTIGPPTTVRTP